MMSRVKMPRAFFPQGDSKFLRASPVRIITALELLWFKRLTQCVHNARRAGFRRQSAQQFAFSAHKVNG
jgi:hypothetical protein